MPQLEQLALVYQSQWFWLLLVLGAIFFFVGRGIVPKVGETVDARDAQIASDLAEAERLRAEADTAEEAWRVRMDQAREAAAAITTAARERSAKDAGKRVDAADRKLAAKADEAAAALDVERRKALAEIEGVAAEATRAIVARLTGAEIGDSAARKAVAGVMNRA
jgi:F-type H+-transporting ATPase subunit b